MKPPSVGKAGGWARSHRTELLIGGLGAAGLAGWTLLRGKSSSSAPATPAGYTDNSGDYNSLEAQLANIESALAASQHKAPTPPKPKKPKPPGRRRPTGPPRRRSASSSRTITPPSDRRWANSGTNVSGGSHAIRTPRPPVMPKQTKPKRSAIRRPAQARRG